MPSDPYVSAFQQYRDKAYPYNYRGQMVVSALAGGTPTNPDVAAAWLRSKGYGGALKDEMLRAQVAEVMQERGVDENAAIEEVAKSRHLTGFRRIPMKPSPRELRHPDFRNHKGQLYVEGRQLKAALKEAASIAADVDKIKARGFGNNSRKGIISFMAEHVFVPERRLFLYHDGEPVMEPDDIHEGFVHTYRGHGIQQLEIVYDAEIPFTVKTDHEFTDEEWAMLWSTGEDNGLGAARNQGWGTFVVTEWEPFKASPNGKAKTTTRRSRKVTA